LTINSKIDNFRTCLAARGVDRRSPDSNEDVVSPTAFFSTPSGGGWLAVRIAC
jgi:hypothetical protein